MTGIELEDELVLALDSEDNVSDVEEYSQLDLLIYRSRSNLETREALVTLLRASIAELIERTSNPGALVNLLVSLKIKDGEIADRLEIAVTTGQFTDPLRRLAALTLLRASDRVLPPRYIVLDEKIRSLAPLQWLDLVLPVLPDPIDRQETIVSLVEIGALGPTEMYPRLHALWAAGGSDPVEFLLKISEHLEGSDHAEFVRLVEDAFEISLFRKHTSTRSPLKEVRVASRLKEHVARVTKGDEDRLKLHRNKSRRNAIVRPFLDFKAA